MSDFKLFEHKVDRLETIPTRYELPRQTGDDLTCLQLILSPLSTVSRPRLSQNSSLVVEELNFGKPILVICADSHGSNLRRELEHICLALFILGSSELVRLLPID